MPLGKYGNRNAGWKVARANLMDNAEFWKGKKVLITGHTGFKGTWLSLWLHQLGARITGYALSPPTKPSLFELTRLPELVDSRIDDVRNAEALTACIHETQPEIVMHLAAQPLVRDSYRIPAETYAVNVMGTVHLLEAIRGCPSVKAVINVTTDKCYENREWVWGYRENEPMGGSDPYSSSKACSELVTAAYRQSFFNPDRYAEHGVAVASARAGNVIGGGDWAKDRLIPDCIRALLAGEPVKIRYPDAIRPWQHVLDPLHGYLLLARRLCEEGVVFAEGWNFGPADGVSRPVEWVVRRTCEIWGNGARYEIEKSDHPHETNYLKLDSSKARSRLGWNSRLDLDTALTWSIEFYSARQHGADARNLALEQILRYQEL